MEDPIFSIVGELQKQIDQDGLGGSYELELHMSWSWLSYSEFLEIRRETGQCSFPVCVFIFMTPICLTSRALNSTVRFCVIYKTFPWNNYCKSLIWGGGRKGIHC